MSKDIEKSRTALLEWHARLLPEAYKPQSCVVLQRRHVERLVDDLLDAAMSLEEQKRIADAALKTLSEPKAEWVAAESADGKSSWYERME